MALSGTEISKTYLGDGSTVNLPISFTFLDNDQVKVKKTYLVDNTEANLIEGIDYTIAGGDPGTTVVMTTAPSSDYSVTVYRSTPRTQIMDYIQTGKFLAEDHEEALDRIVMMIQEIDAGITAQVMSTVGYTRIASQSVAENTQITIDSDVQRMLKGVQGSGGAAVAQYSEPIADGTIDGQELRLVGLSDSDTLEIQSGGNVLLNGTITLKQYSVLDLFWDGLSSQWLESGRRE